MSLRARLDRLEGSFPETRRLVLICEDCPDGRTRFFYDDGTEAPAGTLVPDDHDAQTVYGIDPDELTGVKATDDDCDGVL